MTIHRVFRSDYDGEFIIYQIDYVNGQPEENREWIPNSIKIDHSSDIAVVIGNGLSRDGFNLDLIKNHLGGHLGKKKIVSYGCNALYRDFSPDHLVVSSMKMAEEVAHSGYTKNHIVHAPTSLVMAFPGEFHLMPYSTQMNAGSMATFLAAFDGFKKIFLLGFDNQESVGYNNNIYSGTLNYGQSRDMVHDHKWKTWMAEIFTTYYDVEFMRVNKGPNPDTPKSWLNALNFRNITEREFVTTADL